MFREPPLAGRHFQESTAAGDGWHKDVRRVPQNRLRLEFCYSAAGIVTLTSVKNPESITTPLAQTV